MLLLVSPARYQRFGGPVGGSGGRSRRYAIAARTSMAAQAKSTAARTDNLASRLCGPAGQCAPWHRDVTDGTHAGASPSCSVVCVCVCLAPDTHPHNGPMTVGAASTLLDSAAVLVLPGMLARLHGGLGVSCFGSRAGEPGRRAARSISPIRFDRRAGTSRGMDGRLYGSASARVRPSDNHPGTLRRLVEPSLTSPLSAPYGDVGSGCVHGIVLCGPQSPAVAGVGPQPRSLSGVLHRAQYARRPRRSTGAP